MVLLVPTFDGNIIDVSLQVLSVLGVKTSWTSQVNVAPTFLRLKGIRMKQYVPNSVIKLVWASCLPPSILDDTWSRRPGS